jgi:hypothetical protein
LARAIAISLQDGPSQINGQPSALNFGDTDVQILLV